MWMSSIKRRCFWQQVFIVPPKTPLCPLSSPASISSRMVLKFRDKEISSLEDIQKLKAKDLGQILKSHSELTGGMKADLVL